MGHSKIAIFALVPIILSIGLIPALEIIQEADATTAQGPKGAKSFGSKNNRIVCGDRLCSESEPTPQASMSSRMNPNLQIPTLGGEDMGISPMIDIFSTPAAKGERMSIEVEFEDSEGNSFENVNFNIMATQNGQVVLDEQGVYDDDGEMSFLTMALPADASDASPVDIDVEFLGFGVDEPFTGPIGEAEEIQVVPEFGTIAVMILGVAIISIIAVTAKSKVIPRM